MTLTNHDPHVEREPSGYYLGPTLNGARELTRAECRELGLRPVATDDQGLPRPAQPPVYETGLLFTRDELIDVFRLAWRGDGTIGLNDVDMFITNHRLRPAGHEPFPDMPQMPNDETSATDAMRMRLFREHEERRAITRRARELFSIDGLPKFIPDAERPSPNDTPARRVAKNDKIASL